MTYYVPLIVLSILYKSVQCSIYQYGNTNGGYASYTTPSTLFNQYDYKSGYGSDSGSYGTGSSPYPNYNPSGYSTTSYGSYNTANQGLYPSSNSYSTTRYGNGYNSYSTPSSYGGTGYGSNSQYGSVSTYGTGSNYGAGSSYGTGSSYGSGSIYGTGGSNSLYGPGSTYGSGSTYGIGSPYGSNTLYGSGSSYGTGSTSGLGYGNGLHGTTSSYGSGTYGSGSNGAGSSYGSGYGTGSNYGTNYGSNTNYGVETNGAGSSYGGGNLGSGIGIGGSGIGGVGGYNNYDMSYMNPGEHCTNRSPMMDINVESLYGMWYGVEVIDHLGGPRRYDYYESWRNCIVVQISEPRDQPFSTETPLVHAQQLIGKFKKENRIVRMIWDESGRTSEYSFYFRNDSVGYWRVYSKQNGTLADVRSYQQFGGSVQILSAINDNLVLHFCEEASMQHPAQMYTIILSREPGKIADWEKDSAHNILQQKRLSVVSRRLVCGNSSGTRIKVSLITSLMACTLVYVLGMLS